MATGFAAHSLLAVRYAVAFAQDIHSSLALLHVVTDERLVSNENRVRERDECRTRLRALVLTGADLASEPLFLVKFGSAPKTILETAKAWQANLNILGLHHVQETAQRETTRAKASEVVCEANCPVLTVRSPE